MISNKLLNLLIDLCNKYADNHCLLDKFVLLFRYVTVV